MREIISPLNGILTHPFDCSSAIEIMLNLDSLYLCIFWHQSNVKTIPAVSKVKTKVGKNVATEAVLSPHFLVHIKTPNLCFKFVTNILNKRMFGKISDYIQLLTFNIHVFFSKTPINLKLKMLCLSPQ